MRTKLLLLFTIFIAHVAVGQNAREILDKTSAVYSSGSSFTLTFTLNTEDSATKTTYTHDGKAYVKGNKFKIEIPDATTWFDGKTQWVYIDGTDEVNVSNPTGEELTAISPVALLGIYKSGFKLSYKGTKTEKGKSVYIIEMVPQKKGSDVTKFILKIDKATNLFTEITLKGKDKVDNNLTIKKQEKSSTLADSFFVFNKKDHPNAEIIDLR